MADKKLTPEELRKLLSQPIDVEALMDYEFEYYIWFRGHSHRLEYQRHENVDFAICRFISESGAGEAGDQDKVYVFRDFELWLTLQVVKWNEPGRLEFTAQNHWFNNEETMVFEFDGPDEPESLLS